MPGGYEIGCPLGEGMAVMKRNKKILLDIANSFLYDMRRMKKTCVEIKSINNQEYFYIPVFLRLPCPEKLRRFYRAWRVYFLGGVYGL